MKHKDSHLGYHLRVEQNNKSPSIYSKTHLKAPAIVIIDDDARSIKILEMFFTASQYSTVMFDSAERGLDYLLKNKCPIDLILLDVMLGGMSGLEFLEAIKQSDNLKHVPILLQSSAHQISELHTYDCIYKPYTKRELFKKIDQTLTAALQLNCT